MNILRGAHFGAGFAARMIGREAREALYSLTGVDATVPIVFRVRVTDRCNYRCGFCNHWRRDAYPDEMTVAEWDEIFDSLNALSPGALVLFSGGEPFLRRDFLDIVACAVARGLQWSVITNGYRLNEATIGRIADLDPVTVDVSVDGAAPASHDASRGIPGSFQKITAGIADLARTVAERRLGGRIRLKCTVSRHNWHELDRMVALCTRLGAHSIDFTPVRPDGRDSRAEHFIAAPDLPAFEAVVDRIKALQRRGAPVEAPPSRLDAMIAHFGGDPAGPVPGTAASGSARCAAPLREFIIDPSGKVGFCWFHPKLGSLQEVSADELWRGDRGRAARMQAVACVHAGTGRCASSCLAHSGLSDHMDRLFRHLRMAF